MPTATEITATRRVAAPALTPHRFGLLSVSDVVDDDERLEAGVFWEPIACEPGEVVAVACDITYEESWPLAPRTGQDSVEVLPFLALGSYRCGAASRSLDEAEAFARDHLAAGEERAAEEAIATGAAGNVPSFADATDVTPTAGTAVQPAHGVGLLEEALREGAGSVGAVHVPAVAGVPLASADVMDRHGQRLETVTGQFVSVGGGYPNQAPDGTDADAGEAWLYATGRPQVRRGRVEMLTGREHWLNRSDNQLTVYAARVYLVGWECVTAAVLVDITGS